MGHEHFKKHRQSWVAHEVILRTDARNRARDYCTGTGLNIDEQN
jgi:hypothetical protein